MNAAFSASAAWAPSRAPKGPNIGFFDQILDFLDPGGFQKGPEIDSDSFGPSFSPNGPFWIHLGSIFDFQFFGNPYGVPFWAQPALMGTHGSRRPTFWAQPALTGTHGGRRPTFWRPKADAGGSGGEAPSKMGPFGALLGTPVWKILSRLVEMSLSQSCEHINS